MATTIVSLDGEEVEIPTSLIEDKELFSEVLSLDTWSHCIKEDDKKNLEQLLPKIETQSTEDTLKCLFSGDSSRFGRCPVDDIWQKIYSGALSPEVQAAQAQLQQLKYHQYKLSQKSHYVHLLQEILVSRQQLLQSALFEGSLDKLPLPSVTPPTGQDQRLPGDTVSLKKKANKKYRKILNDIRAECGGMSSDDEGDVPPKSTNQIAEVTKEQPISEEEYRKMLRKHRKRRMRSKVSLNVLLAEQLPERTQVEEPKPMEGEVMPVQPGPISKKLAKLGQEGGGVRRELGVVRSRRKADRGKEKGPEGLMITAEQARAIVNAYEPLDAGVEKEEPIVPIVLEGPLPRDRFLSFFSVLRHAFEPLHDRKCELGKLTRSVRQILRTPECSTSSWYNNHSDWVSLCLAAVCYLAAEVGAVSSFSPLPHFVPIVEFKDRIDHWKWIGHGRDSDLELLILCNHFVGTLDKILPIVDYADYEPPPPHVWTNYVFRRSTPHEVNMFRQLERERYSCPHKAFIYHVHGFEAPVGPVKGSRVTKKDSGSRARGHVLLIPDRPNWVTILSLVRDAASRLPNGEGTRLDLCVLVQDSQFLADSVSETQLNNAVSGALDRLHYEKDPCVRYDSPRKVWIYLHRGRTEQDFERIYWACEVASKQRKMLMSRPKMKPRIIVRTDGKEVVVEQGGVVAAPVEDIAKPAKKTGKTGLAGVGQATLPTETIKAGGGGGGVGGGVLATAVGGSMVLASVFPSGKKHVMAAAKSGKGVLQVTAPPQHYKGASVQQKPSRRRKPSQKVAERLKQQETNRGAAGVTVSGPSLQDSDFESSDEDTLLPFLDSSLSEKERRASQDSTSSWQSSNSDTNDRQINIDLSSVTHHTTTGSIATPPVPTPTFLATINMEAEDVLGGAGLGEAESDGAGVGGATQWLSPPSSTSSSSNNSAE